MTFPSVVHLPPLGEHCPKKAGPGETALGPSTAYHAQGTALSARDKAMNKTDDPTHKFPALKAYILLWSNRQ